MSSETKNPMDTRKELTATEGSKLQKYQSLVIGRRSIGSLIKYEAVTLLSPWIPGALGLWLRSKLYPPLLGSVGCSVIFGTNVILRHPHKIRIQDNVTTDDNTVLDAKGDDNQGIPYESPTIVGRRNENDER